MDVNVDRFSTVSGTFRSCGSRDGHSENGCRAIDSDDAVLCECDTDLCNGEDAENITPPVECYQCVGCDRPTSETCTGQVCLTVSAESSKFMIPSVKLSSMHDINQNN